MASPPARREEGAPRLLPWIITTAITLVLALAVVHLGLAVPGGGSLAWDGDGWRFEEVTRGGWAAAADLTEGDRILSLGDATPGRDDLRPAFDYLEDRETLRGWLGRNADRYRAGRGSPPLAVEIEGVDGAVRRLEVRPGFHSVLDIVGLLLPWVLVASAFLGTALVVLRRSPTGDARNAFVLASSMTAASVLTYGGTGFGGSLAYHPALFPVVLHVNLFTGAAGMAAAALLFLRFPEHLARFARGTPRDWKLIAVSTGFGLLCNGAAATRLIPASTLVVTVMLAFMAGIAVQYHRAWRRSNPATLAQVRWVGLGIFVPTLAWIGLVEGPHTLGHSELADPDLVGLAFASVPVTIAFAILRHRLFDVDLVVRRTVIVSGIFLLLVAGYVALLSAGEIPSFERSAQDVVFLLVVGLLLLPVVVRIEALYDRLFHPRSLERQRAFLDLPDRLTRARSREEVARLLAEAVAEVLAPGYVLIYGRGEGDDRFAPLHVNAAGENPAAAGLDAALADGLESTREGIVLLGPDGESGEVSVPPGCGARLVVPLRSPLGLAGILVCGARGDGKRFDPRAVRALESVATHAATTLENMRLVDEVSSLRNLERELALRQQRAALDTLSSEVAHEIRYPLNFFDNFLRFKSEGQALTHEEIELGTAELDRLQRLLQNLGGRDPSTRADRKPTPLAALVDTCTQVLEASIEPTISIHPRIPQGLRVLVEPHGLQQVVLNLLNNAAEAMGGKGRIEITADANDGTVVLRIRDRGPGIPAEVQDQVFEPFFTTRARGTGLGLSISARIVRRLGGTLVLEESTPEGTVFAVELPGGCDAPGENR